MDPKNMSLDELIKLDKKKGGAASKFAKGGRFQNKRGSGRQNQQGGRPRFENRGRESFRARRTGNMIGKRHADRGGGKFNKVSHNFGNLFFYILCTLGKKISECTLYLIFVTPFMIWHFGFGGLPPYICWFFRGSSFA